MSTDSLIDLVSSREYCRGEFLNRGGVSHADEEPRASAPAFRRLCLSHDLYCSRANYKGAEGIVISVLLPSDAPADVVYVLTVWQKGATQYAPPVYYPPE